MKQDIPGFPEEEGVTGPTSTVKDSLGAMKPSKAAAQIKHFPSQPVSAMGTGHNLCAHPEHLNCTFPPLSGQIFLPWH